MSTTYTKPTGNSQPLHEAASTVSDGVKTLRSDLDELRSDVKSLSSSLGALGKDAAKEMKHVIGSKAHELEEGAREQLDHGLEFARRNARDRPVTTALVVFGTGYLLGRLLRS